jgi:hypothetical protein
MELKKKYDEAFRRAAAAKAADKELWRTRAYRETCALYLDAIDAFTAAAHLEPVQNNKNMVQEQIADFSARARDLAKGAGVQPAQAGGASSTVEDFIKAATFSGEKPGYAFKAGPRGLGYYKVGSSSTPMSSSPSSAIAWPEVPTYTAPAAPTPILAPQPQAVQMQVTVSPGIFPGQQMQVQTPDDAFYGVYCA